MFAKQASAIRRLVMLAASAFSMGLICHAAPIAPAACLQSHRDVYRLSRELAAAGNCPAAQSAHRPLQPVDASPTQVEHDPPCRVDQVSIAAWTRLHGAELSTASKIADRCNAQACMPISAVPLQAHCRCFTPPDDIKATLLGTRTCSCDGRVADADEDGIPDAWEQQLIERFSPHLRFSLGEGGAEEYRPIDPIDYLKQSRLVTSDDDAQALIPNTTLGQTPQFVLSLADVLKTYVPSADGTSCSSATPRAQVDLDPLNDVPHAGASWAEVMASKHIGMYAHVSNVVPRTQDGASLQDLASRCPRIVNETTDTPVTPISWYETHCEKCYRIEYYQFFGYNATHSGKDVHGVDYGDHEGDWEILAVVYDAPTDRILAVSHWAHGYEMRFDMTRAGPRQEVDDPILGKMQVAAGPNAGRDFTLASFHLVSPHTRQENPELAQDNEVRFAKDPVTGEYSHPIAYVEHGGHEFWPTEHGNMEKSPNHNGDDPDHHYQAVGIPNLGEIEHPFGPDAKIVLGYNGAWGHINSFNSPPPGPTLHRSWNWFVPNRVPISCAPAE